MSRYMEAITLLEMLREVECGLPSPDLRRFYCNEIDRVLALPESEAERLTRECDELIDLVTEK